MSDLNVVSIENLVVKYGDKTVLNDITTSFAPREIRVILGTSGCGKTTLLKTIIGLLKPYSGTVRLFGHSIEDPDSPQTTEILKKAGVLFQNGALLGSLTVRDNIALPLEMHTSLPPNVIDEIVHLKLAQVDLPDTADLFPGELSGGMRKRAALARALALEPPVLFCDEPSAGLDPVTAVGLDELLLKLRDALGITIIVVTHELASIEKIADKLIFLHTGRLLFDGTLQKAMALPDGPVRDFFNRREPAVQKQGSGTRFKVENIT